MSAQQKTTGNTRVLYSIIVGILLAMILFTLSTFPAGELARQADEAEQRLKDTKQIANKLDLDRYFTRSQANTLYDPPPSAPVYSYTGEWAKIVTMNPIYHDARIEWRTGSEVQSDVLCQGCGLVHFKWTKPGFDFTVTLVDGRKIRFRKANVKPGETTIDLMVSQCGLVPRLYLYQRDEFVWPTTGKTRWCKSPGNTRPL